MIFALDTNVLLDILYQDEKFHKDSKEILEQKSGEGFFIISPEVYAELVTSFSRKFSDNPGLELDKFLDKKQISLQKHSKKLLEKAGKSWQQYNASGKVECSSCGHENDLECGKCGLELSWRNHLITDFMIGAHAEEKADALITRDRGYFNNYFNIEVIDPSK